MLILGLLYITRLVCLVSKSCTNITFSISQITRHNSCHRFTLYLNYDEVYFNFSLICPVIHVSCCSVISLWLVCLYIQPTGFNQVTALLVVPTVPPCCLLAIFSNIIFCIQMIMVPRACFGLPIPKINCYSVRFTITITLINIGPWVTVLKYHSINQKTLVQLI